jgi:hypothetical protein
MGVNIFVCRVKESYDERGYLDSVKDVGRELGWDSDRFAGDRHAAGMFTGGNYKELLWNCNHPQSGEYTYTRPLDFNKAREWVDANVPEGNRERWYKIFGQMEKDPDLYFYFSW